MDKEQYLVLFKGISADDVFSGIYSIVLIMTIATSTLAVRGKKRLTERQVLALDTGNKILATVATVITLLYACFHIYASVMWNVSMLAIRRLPHGIVLLSGTFGLILTLIRQVRDTIDDRTPSLIEWVGDTWRDMAKRRRDISKKFEEVRSDNPVISR